ncbi:MAG: 16S rRNA (uracil(1498)-N(3))-methyltransferase [Actinobacteria bacterium]|nr:16S rRNA (uracil(1498)-N(3))-methyltransferase [Actinomycetota bacterium]
MLSLYLIDSGEDVAPGSSLRIDGDEAHHMVKVARHSIGDEVSLSDGKGLMARVVISEISREGVTVQSDRAHECIELLVEAGADEIIPWQATRSVGKWQGQASREKWSEWIRGAVKQSRRNRIPALGDLISSSADLKLSSEKSILIVFDENSPHRLDVNLKDELNNRGDVDRVFLVIGPEGGITPEELSSLSNMGGITLRLGGPVLRSAHAGAIALAGVQSALSIWR